MSTMSSLRRKNSNYFLIKEAKKEEAKRLKKEKENSLKESIKEESAGDGETENLD